jgi:hypothetical protein
MEKTSSRAGDQNHQNGNSEEKRAFKPRDGKVLEHRKVGVWELYQERDQFLSYFPTSWKIEAYAGIWKDLPYLWRTLRDLCTVAWPPLFLYLILTFVKSLLPALTLWCVTFSLPRQRTAQCLSGIPDSSL